MSTKCKKLRPYLITALFSFYFGAFVAYNYLQWQQPGDTNPLLPKETQTVKVKNPISTTAITTAHPNNQRLESIHNLLQPRIWDFWAPRPLPCFPPNPRYGWAKEFAHILSGRTSASNTTMGGLFMGKPQKVGGSTAAGVHIRIMHQLAPRLGKDFAVCRGNFRHRLYRTSKDDDSFLWSVVRDPTKRAISAFFHFEVSRNKVEATDANFIASLELDHNETFSIEKQLGHYAQTLSLENLTEIPNNPLDVYQNILQSYHFLGVTERMDESLVLLKELLGLRMSDILHLNAKQNGGWDGGGSQNGCTLIVPSYVSPGMKAYFASDEWVDRIQYDLALHVAVNQSLDLTIDQNIGRERFRQALLEFQQAQHTIQQRCQEEAIFPCSSGGEKRKRKETNCYWSDSGCGYPCIDRVVAELGL